MTIRTKPILATLGIIVIAGVALRYCAQWGKNVVLVPLHGGKNGKSATTPPSHARAQGTNPLSAFANAFKTPIELYGNVVDQHGDPVPGATVTLSPVDAPFGDESHSGTVLVSDAKGKFSVKGLHGFSMGVSVKKEGYLHLSPLGGPASSAMVSYAHGAEQGKRYSNPATPLVLLLHKIGPMEPMVYVKERNCRLPVDGTVRSIALDSEKGTGTHQIEFRFKTGWVNIPDDNEHFGNRFDWTFEARIPGGGFIWSDNDYNFEAPESGYRESIRLEYKADMPREKWQRMVYGSFFVKFADGSHGRIRFSIDGMEREGDSPLMLASWLNLKPGSRNLATNRMDGTSFDIEKNKKEWGW
jgi:hypothetical protein